MTLDTDQEYTFTLRLYGVTPDTHGIEDRLFEAGCDDATLSFRDGVPFLTFTRKAASRNDAILSACRDCHAAGVQTMREAIKLA